MNPNTGAFRHISVGVEELSKYFDIIQISPPIFKQSNSSGNSLPSNRKKKNPVRGLAKDIKTFIKNHALFFSLYRQIKKAKPDFIYERIAYLNYNGLLIAKLLSIKHFYELNGIPHYAIRKYYSSHFNFIIKKIETLTFVYSDFLFIVGSWNKVVELKRNNWVNIENGIENEFLEYFEPVTKQIGTSKINLVFIGHLMEKNHNPNLLKDVLNNLQYKDLVRLNLIGSQMDDLLSFCREHNIDAVYHGYLNREEIIKVLEYMHVGLIPGGEEYPSFMKIFEYGASKCLVIAPDLYNLKYWFGPDDILFFKKNSSKDFQDRLNEVIINPNVIKNYGSHIHETIKQRFTWPKIFSEICSVIDSKLK
ncbi:MAG TPA: glycosyltransferase [Agriterribacter sp.]|nr:glycosyltransferase [Agriterribacter sp.]